LEDIVRREINTRLSEQSLNNKPIVGTTLKVDYNGEKVLIRFVEESIIAGKKHKS
jgi:hypothetical protein